MKLISEFNDQQLEVITEQKDGKKKLYIEGVFAQAEKKNRNGRVYPMAIMEKAVGKYVDDQVSKGSGGDPCGGSSKWWRSSQRGRG